jgi:hypothetical protein
MTGCSKKTEQRNAYSRQNKEKDVAKKRMNKDIWKHHSRQNPEKERLPKNRLSKEKISETEQKYLMRKM